MLIISDDGKDMVNFDVTFVVSTQPHPTAGLCAVAFGPGLNTVLTVGSEKRIRQCLDAVSKAVKENWKILDLRDILGQRPNLTVAQPQIVLPGNGGPTA